jgi:hypothetical protein
VFLCWRLLNGSRCALQSTAPCLKPQGCSPPAVAKAYGDWAGKTCKLGCVLLIVKQVSTIADIKDVAKELGTTRLAAVCLAPVHGCNTQASLVWDTKFTATDSSINAVKHLTKRVHLLSCLQGLFLGHMAPTPGVVVSGYNADIDCSAEIDDDDEIYCIEPQHWQLKYLSHGLISTGATIRRHRKKRCTCMSPKGALVLRASNGNISVF